MIEQIAKLSIENAAFVRFRIQEALVQVQGQCSYTRNVIFSYSVYMTTSRALEILKIANSIVQY